jgi:flagellar protein FliO/FliZ
MMILQGSSLLDKLNEKPIETSPDGLSTQGNILQLLGLILLLAFILAAAYYTSKFVGGLKLNQMKHSNFRVLDTYRISSNKALQLIKIGTKYVVIAIGKDTVTVITELSEAEIVMNETNTEVKQSFKQILEHFKNK